MSVRPSYWFVLCCVVAAVLGIVLPAVADVLSPDPTAGTPVPEENQKIKDAIAKFKDRDFDGALALLETACKENADLPPPTIIMAQFCAGAQFPQGVRNYLERTVKDYPKDPEAYVLMGDIAIREGRITEADMLYVKADSLIPDFKASAKRKDILQPRVLLGRAALGEVREDWDGAQKLIDAWLKLDPKEAKDPDRANVLQFLARVKFKQKNPTETLSLLQKAKDKDPKGVLTPEAQLGLLYEAFPDHENAKIWMERALVKAPKDFRTRFVVGQWCLETGQLDKAKEYATTAIGLADKEKSREIVAARILRGNVALFQRDFKLAEEQFLAATLEEPGNFAASNNLALALVEQGESEKKRRALQYAERNAQTFQQAAEAWSTLGWVYFLNDKIDQAEQALGKAASAGQLSPDTAYYIARVLLKKYGDDRRDRAKDLLDKAVKTKQPFSKQAEAKQLLKDLKG